MADHIVKSYQNELDLLSSKIAQIGGLAEEELVLALDIIVSREIEFADRVIQQDRQLDDLDRQIGQDAVRILALRQPVGADLREVVCAIKISANLERIGDLAANIAKRARLLNQEPALRLQPGLSSMGHQVLSQLKDALDAYSERDAGKALAVWRRDEEIDGMYTSLFRELLTYMMEDPRTIGSGTHLLFVAKNLERIGDHATNIAELVHYLVSGEELMQVRPRGNSIFLSGQAAQEGDKRQEHA